jgi:hypothetical protein
VHQLMAFGLQSCLAHACHNVLDGACTSSSKSTTFAAWRNPCQSVGDSSRVWGWMLARTFNPRTFNPQLNSASCFGAMRGLRGSAGGGVHGGRRWTRIGCEGVRSSQWGFENVGKTRQHHRPSSPTLL